MKAIEISSVVFACCTLGSVLYWQVFHFVVTKRLRFQLFALRDAARRIAIERDLGVDPHFKELERFICKTIAISPSISLTSFLVYCMFYDKKLAKTEVKRQTLAEIKKFEDEAPAEFVGIRNETAKFSIFIMCFNAPLAMVFGAVGGLVMAAFGKLNRLGLYRSAEKFVEEVAPNKAGASEEETCLQPV